MARLLFKIVPFSTMRICQIAFKLAEVSSKFCQILFTGNILKWPKFFNVEVKWLNFAQIWSHWSQYTYLCIFVNNATSMKRAKLKENKWPSLDVSTSLPTSLLLYKIKLSMSYHLIANNSLFCSQCDQRTQQEAAEIFQKLLTKSNFTIMKNHRDGFINSEVLLIVPKVTSYLGFNCYKIRHQVL